MSSASLTTATATATATTTTTTATAPSTFPACDHGDAILTLLSSSNLSSSSSSSSSKMNLIELLSSCIDLADRAGAVIREVYSSGNLDTIDKSISSSHSRSASTSSTSNTTSPTPTTSSDSTSTSTSTTTTFDSSTISRASASAALLSSLGMSSGGANAKLDAVGDPQTIADVRAQRLLVGSLRNTFPGLTVIGEEDEDDELVNTTTNVRPRFDMISSSLLSRFPASFQQVPIEQVVVWIDPLDGTKEFTIGNVEGVTVLLGIAVYGRAVAGVISSPFTRRTVYGCIGVGVGILNTAMTSASSSSSSSSSSSLSTAEQVRQQAVAERRARGENRVVVTSRSHFTPQLKTLLDTLKPDKVVRTGGAGVKGVLVLDGRADAYVFPQLGTKKWDVAAVDACIHAAGGCCTDAYGAQLAYDKDVEKENLNGIVCTNNRDTHLSYCLKATEKVAKF